MDTPPPTEVAAAGPPDAGRLVDGRYQLAEVIGTGGMATVHRALDTRLGRSVAVKLLRREAIADPDIAMRFRREALAATVLRHPNIVACLETGTDRGQPYLVMELIEGEDLAARLRRVGRLAPADAVRIGLDVARALGVAHVRGIVHRDVKPGNILLARDGRAMMTDFGIARLAADTEGAVPGTTLGSVHYFSPEQATGATTTPASDVYSLGLVLFESLTGGRAWKGDSTAALAAARVGSAAPSPRDVRPEIPGSLDAVVRRALDPDPARRFENGNAIAAALEPLVVRPDPVRPARTIGAAAAAPVVASTPAPLDRAPPPLRPASSPAPVAARAREGLDDEPDPVCQARLARHRRAAGRPRGRRLGGRRRHPDRGLAEPRRPRPPRRSERDPARDPRAHAQTDAQPRPPIPDPTPEPAKATPAPDPTPQTAGRLGPEPVRAVLRHRLRPRQGHLQPGRVRPGDPVQGRRRLGRGDRHAGPREPDPRHGRRHVRRLDRHGLPERRPAARADHRPRARRGVHRHRGRRRGQAQGQEDRQARRARAST